MRPSWRNARAAADGLVEAALAEVAAEAARHGEAATLPRLLERLHARPLLDDEWTMAVGALLRGGFSAAASETAGVALRHFPQNPQLHYFHGNALRLCGRFDAAERELRALLRHQPRHRDAALSLAFMLREQGRYDAAVQVLLDSTRARHADAAETLATLGFLRECGAFGAAHALAQQARARWPGNAEIAASAGEFALAAGAFETAQACLRAVLEDDPRKGASWLRLSRCQRYTDRDDAELQRYRRAWQNTGAHAQTRACIGFALGKALDDVGDLADAARVLGEANALVRATQPWDRGAWDAFVARQLAQPAPRISSGHDFEPLFVVGLPRTGTTLATTLLARDAQLRERGELNWIGAMQAHLDEQAATHDPAALQATAQLVALHMRRDDAPARVYLDKNPLNFRYLGLIAALFPRAKIVHCRRNLRDTALSLWMQHFDHADAGFAYAFDDIAHYARSYERLMRHWRATLALPVFELDYEALVGDRAATLARLAEFTGSRVPLGAAAQPAAIATASVWQARQPLHSDSIGRWRRYAPLLPALAEL